MGGVEGYFPTASISACSSAIWAGAAVADRRADRPRRAKKWDGFRVAITGSENNYQLWRVEHISMSQLAPKYPLPEFVRAANEALANMIGWASR